MRVRREVARRSRRPVVGSQHEKGRGPQPTSTATCPPSKRSWPTSKLREVDRIVLNGDLADGPFPTETLDRLQTLGERAIWLRGNGDRWLVEARAGRFRHPDAGTDALIGWAASRLTPEHVARLAALPLTRLIDVAGLGRVGLCHATSRSDNEMVLVDSPVAHLRAAFSAIDGETLGIGHSHMPFDRLFDRRRVVNAGSVGMPYGHGGASWALIGPNVVLRRTSYDIDAAWSRIMASGMPDAEEFVRTYVRATPSDEEALASFRETIRKQQESGHFD